MVPSSCLHTMLMLILSLSPPCLFLVRSLSPSLPIFFYGERTKQRKIDRHTTIKQAKQSMQARPFPLPLGHPPQFPSKCISLQRPAKGWECTGDNEKYWMFIHEQCRRILPSSRIEICLLDEAIAEANKPFLFSLFVFLTPWLPHS